MRDLEFDERALLFSKSKGKSSDLSAERLAEDLHPTKVAKQWQKCQQQGLDLGVQIFSAKPRPRMVVEKLVEATKVDEKGVLGYLKDQATQLQVYTNRRSLKYVAAGLRCWHCFAVGCLGYLPCRTLPPRCAYDVVRSISIFHNGGTAANYVGYLKFGCNLKGFLTTWCEKQVSVVLKGLSKASLDHFGGPQRTKYLLTTGALYALVAYFDITDFQFAVALLGNWENLLRTQSEGLMMFVGEPQDQTVRPPRPNGVHVDKKGQANLWLKKRKHRPAGSMLTRSCSCSMTTKRFCWACNIKNLMENKKTGDVLWSYTPLMFLDKVKAALKCLKLEEAWKNISFKSWRAGKATECLKMNMP